MPPAEERGDGVADGDAAGDGCADGRRRKK